MRGWLRAPLASAIFWVAVPGTASAGPIEWVVIGDPGNGVNFAGEGSVAEVFRVSKHEITNSQYVDLLNAVAASDPNGLYDPNMTLLASGGIDRSGTDGSYVYTVKAGFEDRPANEV